MLKSKDDILRMRVSGSFVGQILSELANAVVPGISTADLDALAEARCKDLGVKPAFKGLYGFPGCVCFAVNHEVVHGIPSKKKILRDGDIVGLDFGVVVDGWYADSALTVAVGAISLDARKLLEVTEQSLYKGIEQCIAGNRLYDIGYTIQNYVESAGYSVVREFVGHGIGRALHEEPQVPNYGKKSTGIVLREGMVLAIEPMVNIGKKDVKTLSDGWTVVTADGSQSAHFEHTIAITAHGPEILTARI